MRLINAYSFKLWLLLLFTACNPEPKLPEVTGHYKPWEIFDSLYHQVQLSGIYPDSKTFPDCAPLDNPYVIARAYEQEKSVRGFELQEFVDTHFEEPIAPALVESPEEPNLSEHLSGLWGSLSRDPKDSITTSTLINLPGEYVVPGGRFREVYYWDSYFTMIGLGVSGRTDLVEGMIRNFAYLIDTIGFIPNGNRTYYLGRSQPPFFAAMVRLLGQLTNREKALEYLPAVQKEYDFWMKGSDELNAAQPAINRVVRLENGAILNRYYDFNDTPRPESYKEDYEMAEELPHSEQRELYRNLRAGAESGWDYSTRWFADKSDFVSIRTVDMLPVDLNCLIYHMEKILASGYELTGDEKKAVLFQQKAQSRLQWIREVFWNEELQAFADFIWIEGQQSEQLTLAGAFPLYFRIASDAQAKAQISTMVDHLLKPGGFVTTTIASGQQWDSPNGWAPLQWIAIKGLEHYGEAELADDIADRWIKINEKVFRNTGKMMEKYNVVDTSLIAGGGEYPTQDGFGWTNGVYLGLKSRDVKY